MVGLYRTIFVMLPLMSRRSCAAPQPCPWKKWYDLFVAVIFHSLCAEVEEGIYSAFHHVEIDCSQRLFFNVYKIFYNYTYCVKFVLDQRKHVSTSLVPADPVLCV